MLPVMSATKLKGLRENENPFLLSGTWVKGCAYSNNIDE